MHDFAKLTTTVVDVDRQGGLAWERYEITYLDIEDDKLVPGRTDLKTFMSEVVSARIYDPHQIKREGNSEDLVGTNGGVKSDLVNRGSL